VSENPFTTAIHGDDGVVDGADVAPPIRVTTTYDRSSQPHLVYRRDEHVTTHRLEAVLGAMEGGSAVVFSSGMAAVAALLNHVRPQRIALGEDVYTGTRLLVEREVGRRTLALAAPDALESGDLWWLETPSNPKCLVTDITAVVDVARSKGLVVAVDSTFATPMLQNPLGLGADFVMHSTTKFIGGHSDAIGGVVVTNEEAAGELHDNRSLDGAVAGSLDTWLTLRGLRTLPLRVERQSATATAVAAYLNGKVPVVWHPSLPGHPGHEVARRQMRSWGGIISFEVESLQRATAVRDALRLIHNATSLGGVETLADLRREHDPSAPEGLIRLAIGLEAAEDLIEDLDQALG
jgi:cystathionine gamma-synthase